MDAREAVDARLARLGVREIDLVERFVRSGGHGGQNVNKVASCVVLTHRPTGLTIRAEEARSQGQNRLLARRRLAERLEDRARETADQARRAVERERRRHRGRNRASKETTLRHKRRRSEVKRSRRAPPGEE